MNDKELKQWLKERDEAVLSLDVTKFKKFYHKWEAKGVYDKPLPSDRVNEAVENGEITEEEARAELWWDSLDNGYD